MREQPDQEAMRSLSLTPSEAANIETAEQLKSLTQQMNLLTGMFTEFLSAMKPQRSDLHAPAADNIISVLTPPKVPEAIKFNALDPDHIVSRLFEIEFYIGQLPLGKVVHF